MLNQSIQANQGSHQQCGHDAKKPFKSMISTRKDSLADKPEKISCCDTCKKTDEKPKQLSFQVFGRDDPCRIYAGENNELLRVLAIGEKLKERGHHFCYYAVDKDPGAFVCEPAAMQCIENSENDYLPLTVSKGKILKRGEYPDQEDFLTWAGVEMKELDLQREAEIQAIAACETVRTIVCLNADDCFSCRQCFLSESKSPKASAADST